MTAACRGIECRLIGHRSDGGQRVRKRLRQLLRTRGQLQTALASHQQRIVEHIPKSRQCMADGRLRAVKPRSCARDVSFLDQGFQHWKQAEVGRGQLIHILHIHHINEEFSFHLSMMHVPQQRSRSMMQSAKTDLGFSHVALVVRDLDRSISFYEAFADLHVVHRRVAGGDVDEVAGMADGVRPFALVLVASARLRDTSLGPFGHLGITCAQPEDVFRRAAQASARGILRSAPRNDGPPVGLWTYIADPDGNTLELSFGQEIAFTVQSDKCANA
ncbi:catechol 2,3-dioxygenase-like lactoylglutathione lyase family enzyme [Sphingobium sp. B7D2B]|nr:VOC family protein [Sphingobium sp. B7D2B]MCW2365128.1 catechol 2,3-dioxygenase-like lactoylglutathione lyase family enzyme [Sphingobium sp. B7D2B]